MDEIMQFFDFTKPCPDKIRDCESLRHQYGQDFDNVRKQGGCGSCAERNLRQQYIARLQQQLIQ